MKTVSFYDEIIRIGFTQGIYKPHKHIAILAAIRLLRDKPENDRRIYYDDDFKTYFAEYFERFAGYNDRNRPYTPFFHLRKSTFWNLSPCQGKEDDLLSLNTVGGPGQLMEFVSHAEVSSDFYLAVMDDEICSEMESLILDCLNKGRLKSQEIQEIDQEFERIQIAEQGNIGPNPFIAYLNSLHSRDAGNENALAESQACNRDFSRIHVRHPFVDTVVSGLIGESGKSVILTGHAGDGKSTLALAVYKHLKGLEPAEALPCPLQRREDLLLPGGVRLAIVKDLSEWRIAERDSLLDEVKAKRVRVLLVSNTGTLLDAFCGYAERKGLGSRAEWEPLLLKAMDAESETLSLGASSFACFNLALHDNLPLARQIFERMLAPENWSSCNGQSCRDHCPVYRNVELFLGNSGLAVNRLFLAYRRMYEYGTRLTIRQLTGHLAYLLTSGLEYADIRSLGERPVRPLISEFLFYNRFFGDNGRQGDQAAVRMRVITEVLAHGFGSRPCPSTERYLWLLTHGDDFKLGVPSMEKEFGQLRRYGALSRELPNGLTPDQAREQVRRMLYFLHEFRTADRGNAFLRSFLGSLSLLTWDCWQQPEARLSMEAASHFKQRVFHVLQEQFTGVRLPEIGAAGQGRLYITLSRRRLEIRQSAQVVLAQIDYANEFKICLVPAGRGQGRRDLVLQGQGRLEGIGLTLSLPFLDYVLARHQGEMGETLQAAYTHRLESLKAKLLKRCRNGGEEDMLLVRLRTNHTFVRQLYAVADGRLEVSNA